MKKAVVVGGAGFIGSNVVDKILSSNESWDEVVVIDNFSTGKIENIDPRASIVDADIRNFNEIQEHFKGAECVWHLAALPRVEPSIKDPVLFNDINVNGTLNVFTACKNHNVKKIVFSSSSSVYGEPIEHPTPEHADFNPMSPYALQKLHCEQYAKLFCDLYDMNISCLRYFNVYGKREPTEGAYVPVIGIWLRQLRQGKKLTITGDGNQTRDFINVFDVAEANYVASHRPPKGFSVYNVGSGKNYVLNDVARWICRDESKIEYIEPRVEPRITLADVRNLVEMSCGDLPEPKSLKDYIASELSKDESYIEEVESYFAGRKINVMDIGCAGGQLIVDFHKRGHLAIGLEGSDYNIKHSQFNWPVYHQKVLWTADLTKPLKIMDSQDDRILFDIISAWEVVEHIRPGELDIFFDNVLDQLKPDGIFVSSVNMGPDVRRDVNGNLVILHQSVFPEDYWKKVILKDRNVDFYPFNNKVRNCTNSFYMTMRKK